MLAKYPDNQRQSAVISALLLVQKDNDGWLSKDLMNCVADYIRMPKISVYEVATFYGMYELEPVGKNKIYVCTNLSCMLRGSNTVVEHIETKLGIKLGQSTKDGKFLFKEAECLAACGGAPMMQVNDDYHEGLTPEKIDKILEELD